MCWMLIRSKFWSAAYIELYVLIRAITLIDVQAPTAKNTSHQIHTKCLIKHQKIIQKH